MMRLVQPISCPACTFDYPPSDGYVCTLAGYDHFRCPQCNEMVSKVIDSEDGADIQE
ncbi:MAG: hypothetical protein PVF93_06620 [Chromatiaceae bacterium]|jgi:predicted RNA-binding Zn-ribbon protein involved in translation (DUF1610 family)